MRFEYPYEKNTARGSKKELVSHDALQYTNIHERLAKIARIGQRRGPGIWTESGFDFCMSYWLHHPTISVQIARNLKPRAILFLEKIKNIVWCLPMGLPSGAIPFFASF